MTEKVKGELEKKLEESIQRVSARVGFAIGKVDGGYWRGCYRTHFQVGKYLIYVSQVSADKWVLFVTREERNQRVSVMQVYMDVSDFEEKFNIVVTGCAAQGKQ